MKNDESQEMYLETIFLLKEKLPIVRSVDVVEELGYAKSSVSRGVNLLEKKELIVIDRSSGEIHLTLQGKIKAENIYERHRILTDVFVEMGASKDMAEENACRVEHVITDDMFAVLQKFAKKEYKTSPK